MSDAPGDLSSALDQLRCDFDAELSRVSSDAELELLRIKSLGRKSPVAARLKQLGALPASLRGEAGKALNLLKASIEQRLADARGKFLDRPLAPSVDVTLPGAAAPAGRLHPISSMLKTIVDLFVGLGFEIAQGPELEQ